MKVIRKKIIFYFIALVLICLFSHFLLSEGFLNKNPDFMLYLASAVIQAYAALIAIPLTISVVHLSRMYGSPLVDILIKESKGIFAIYIPIVVISVFNMVIDPAPGYLFIMLLLQLSVCIFPLYPLVERLRNLLTISPPQIMKVLGYPEKLKELADKGKLTEINIKFLKGLSLIRSCIMDLSLRDYLSPTIDTFSKAISIFPWSDKNLKEKKIIEGRVQQVDRFSIALNIVQHLDECITDPLKHIEILPDPSILSPLFRELNKAFVKMDISGTSIFDDYLRKLSVLVGLFVENRKTDALNLFFYSMFWFYKESGKEIPANAVSKAISLSASSIENLKTKHAEREDIKSIFLITSQAFMTIKIDPKIFVKLQPEAIDAWIYLIKEGDRTDLGWMITCLSFVKEKLVEVKRHEHPIIYERAKANFFRVLNEIKEKLVKNNWKIFLDDNHLNILNISDNTIGSLRLDNIVGKSEKAVLRSFIDNYLKDVTIPPP